MKPSPEDVRASIVEFLVRVANVPLEHLRAEGVMFGDLNIDSLAAVEMLWSVEQAYGIPLPNPDHGLAGLTIDELASRLAAQLASPLPAEGPVP